MKDLKNVIRLHKWRLDERRVQLSALERNIALLKQRIEYAQQDHKKQQELKARTILKDVHFDGQIYGQYVLSYEEMKIRLTQEVLELEQQIEKLVEEITLIFQDLKKYEISQEQRDTEEQNRISKKLQSELDEYGIKNYKKRLN